MSYAQHEHFGWAAAAAGWEGKEGHEMGLRALADTMVSTQIVSHMRARDAISADLLAEVWGLKEIEHNSEEEPTLFERIQSAREKLARTRLPEPSEIVITRPPLSRRKARAARLAATAAQQKET